MKIPIWVFVGFGDSMTSSSLDTIRNNLTANLALCQQRTANFYCEGCGNVKSFALSCYIRLCTRCIKARNWRLLKRFRGYLKLFSNPKLLTLTFQGVQDFNKKTKRRLDLYVYNFFRRIRKFFKFGIRSMELKHRENGYYIHYHILLESCVMSQSRLSQIWHEITKTSYVVDIRRVNGLGGLIYILKYATKPINFDIGIDEYIRDFYKTRLITPFGEIYALSKEKIKSYVTCENCNSYMKFSSINEPIENHLNNVRNDLEFYFVIEPDGFH